MGKTHKISMSSKTVTKCFSCNKPSLIIRYEIVGDLSRVVYKCHNCNNKYWVNKADES